MTRFSSFLQALVFGAICAGMGMYAMYQAWPDPVYEVYWSDGCSQSI